MSGSLSIPLRGNGHAIGTALFTGCGPGSSMLSVSLRPGTPKGTRYYVVVRPGTCSSLPAGPWYSVGFTGGVTRGFPAEANPPLSVELFRGTRFVIELVVEGSIRATACAEHDGPEALSTGRDHQATPPYGASHRLASGALLVRLDEIFVTATITPLQGGKRSRVVIRGPYGSSTGSHVRLRRGSCDRPRAAGTRELVLDPYVADPDGGSRTIASQTDVDLPLSTLARGGWTLDIHDGQFTTIPVACAHIGPRPHA